MNIFYLLFILHFTEGGVEGKVIEPTEELVIIEEPKVHYVAPTRPQEPVSEPIEPIVDIHTDEKDDPIEEVIKFDIGTDVLECQYELCTPEGEEIIRFDLGFDG